MDSKKLALLCRELAENKKAENVTVLDVSAVSSVTDYFVVASGTSEPHLRAIVNEITDSLLEDHRIKPFAVDGDTQTQWHVLDFFDVIVHVMRADVRARYDLEGLWGDAINVAEGGTEGVLVATKAKSKNTGGQKKATKKPVAKPGAKPSRGRSANANAKAAVKATRAPRAAAE